MHIARILNIHRGTRSFAIVLLLSLGAFCPNILGGIHSNTVLPPTVAEASDFTATSTSTEVSEFLHSCAEAAEHIRIETAGSTVDGKPLEIAIVSQQPWAPGDLDDRSRVLLLGNIHSGECAGKEALLQLLRELAQAPDDPRLENTVIVFLPNYNADGNDRMDQGNRPGQIGPTAGMGERPNSQGLDLNRDFMKAESPEARTLIGLLHTMQPDLFIDCHTTNGSEHQYQLTYDIPHNPATSAAIRNYLRGEFMPRVTASLLEEGTRTFYYGNFNADKTRWSTYGHEPRYSTEYGGLAGTLAILSEAYAHISYRERIEASYKFVSACLNQFNSERENIRDLLTQSRNEWIRRGPGSEFSLTAELTSFPEPVTILGIEDGRPQEFRCEFAGNYESVTQTVVPQAWILPPECKSLSKLLQTHHIRFEVLKTPQEMTVEVDRILKLDRSGRSFQGHFLQRCQADRRTETREIPAGSLMIPADQPSGRIAAYLLESESDDGLITWNFLDEWLTPNQDSPVLRLPANGRNETAD